MRASARSAITQVEQTSTSRLRSSRIVLAIPGILADSTVSVL